MKIAFLFFIAGFVITVLTVCRETGNDVTDLLQDGSLSVVVQGVTAGDGMSDFSDKHLFVYLYDSGDTGSTPLAGDYKAIDGITEETIVLEKMYSDSDTTWLGQGDNDYDVYAFIDMGDPSETFGQYDAGSDFAYKDYPITYTQDGDRIMVLSSADFSQ